MGGVTLDLNWFVSNKFIVDGQCTNFFSGFGHFAGEVEFGGGNSGSNEGAIGNLLGGFIGRKGKKPFFTFDAKIAIPAVGQFDGKSGLVLGADLFFWVVNKKRVNRFWGRFGFDFDGFRTV